MEAFFAALEATGPAQYLRVSRWGYAAVSGAHILGIALLVGAILPLNLRLIGLWPTIPRAQLLRVLVPVAAAGLTIAVPTGILLFSVRAQEYAAIGYLQVKLALVLVGILSAVMIHHSYGLTLEGANRGRLRFHALISIGCCADVSLPSPSTERQRVGAA
jgi:hypothetical protein